MTAVEWIATGLLIYSVPSLIVWRVSEWRANRRAWSVPTYYDTHPDTDFEGFTPQGAHSALDCCCEVHVKSRRFLIAELEAAFRMDAP
jgi:hypothetical protein